ncbi:hypothetical protein QLQ12_39800 [Actinoplanes sp. NEAU-A12]|uniref:Aminoglycoside phosphotransferase n=1 Tax=Actinoplanes sandaracinus TaxID=3045177 RepID=A0ABT6WYC4_9ACTN|nr:hypothetical protein [Actinoplanes sandaracinus]MDI6104753.1 hypothetical protein [Actinoplanes sandaracinus]
MADPPPGVLRAFGAPGPARPLPGGQGTSWRAGDLVLKPESGPVHEWLGEVLDGLSGEGFRVAAPVRTGDGAWSHAGWSATRWVEGEPPDYTAEQTWLGIIEAGRAFHRALAHLRRPGFTGTRQDWWARADRVAWQELAVPLRPEFTEVAARLRGLAGPLGPPQVVHCDLSGNVLFAPGLPPAVIDVSPYWRPPAYAEGVVVADALCWHGMPPSLAAAAGVPVAAVARALLFRLATTSERGAPDAEVRDEARRYRLAAEAIGA